MIYSHRRASTRQIEREIIESQSEAIVSLYLTRILNVRNRHEGVEIADRRNTSLWLIGVPTFLTVEILRHIIIYKHILKKTRPE